MDDTAGLDGIRMDERYCWQGIGSRLLSDLEREAKEKGAFLVMADARDWNAEFFRRSGYAVYCTIEDCPEGYRKYKMLKRL